MQHARLAPASAANTTVSQAVRQASARTGTEFGYLMRTAMRESSMNPDAKAAGSSAVGLFQFVEQTWLGVMKNHGAEHGLGAYADAIKTDSRGRQYVPDGRMRQEILALRRDPQVSALMAGELSEENREALQSHLGRRVSDGELYAAHFLGADAAGTLLKKAETAPSACAADLFPAAARANRSIFYAKDGRARTVAEVCDRLTGGAGQSGGAAETMLANNAVDLPAAGDTGRLRFAAAGSAGGAAPGGGMPPRQALMLSPRVIALLSSLDPIPGGFKPGRAMDDQKAAVNTIA